jgi:hypothetical protein
VRSAKVELTSAMAVIAEHVADVSSVQTKDLQDLTVRLEIERALQQGLPYGSIYLPEANGGWKSCGASSARRSRTSSTLGRRQRSERARGGRRPAHGRSFQGSGPSLLRSVQGRRWSRLKAARASARAPRSRGGGFPSCSAQRRTPPAQHKQPRQLRLTKSSAARVSRQLPVREHVEKLRSTSPSAVIRQPCASPRLPEPAPRVVSRTRPDPAHGARREHEHSVRGEPAAGTKAATLARFV